MTDAAQTTPTTTTAETPAASPFTPEMIAATFGDDLPEATTAPAPTPAEETEVPPAAESKPKEPGVSDRIAAAVRAEKKAEQAREEQRKRANEIEQREKALAAEAEEVRLFREDPSAFIAKKNWSQAQVAEFLEKLAGTYKPEAVADQKLTAQEQRIADLEAKLAAEEAAKRAAQQRQLEENAGQQFIEHVAADAEKYPHLTEVYSAEEAVAEGFAMLTQVIGKDADGKPVTRVQAFMAKHGRGPTDQEIAEHLDSIAKAKIESRAKAPWRKGAATDQARQAASGESKEVPMVKGTSPRTLSRADTSTRAAAPRTNEWTQEKADEESLRILEKAMRK